MKYQNYNYGAIDLTYYSIRCSCSFFILFSFICNFISCKFFTSFIDGIWASLIFTKRTCSISSAISWKPSADTRNACSLRRNII